jgi:hypothetical protein
MKHGEFDRLCPISQAVEFFTGLRRLGKKVWLLEYEGAYHVLSGKSAEDYSTRMHQFFDHYLKGTPAPKWMVEGIPAKEKGFTDGFELEPIGIVPGSGMLRLPEIR